MADYEDVYAAGTGSPGKRREKDSLHTVRRLWSGAVEPDFLEAAFRCSSTLKI
jgi:hypothetical protein